MRCRLNATSPKGENRGITSSQPGNSYNAGMSANTSQAELTLLKYLQEHSGGSGERPWLDPRSIARGLRISLKQFTEDSVSLAAQGFAGVRDFRPDAHDAPSLTCSAIWLTRKGEDYLRGLIAWK